MTVKEIVEEHLKAEKRFRKRVLASPEASRRFLIRAGIWDKLPKKPPKKVVKQHQPDLCPYCGAPLKKPV